MSGFRNFASYPSDTRHRPKGAITHRAPKTEEELQHHNEEKRRRLFPSTDEIIAEMERPHVLLYKKDGSTEPLKIPDHLLDFDFSRYKFHEGRGGFWLEYDNAGSGPFSDHRGPDGLFDLIYGRAMNYIRNGRPQF